MNPWMKSFHSDMRGVDVHAAVAEALGDAVLYLWSTCHAAQLPAPDLDTGIALLDVPNAIAAMGIAFGELVAVQSPQTVAGAAWVIAQTCNLCAVDLHAAAAKSMEKFK